MTASARKWVRLFAIDAIKGDLTTLRYCTPLAEAFLKAHPTLVVAMRHFHAALKRRLLEAIGDVDEITDGLLIHSENFQVL
jgi:adenine-specific DNA-methyltransferase